jgi:hypothetical protein
VLIAQEITVASGVTVTCGTWTCFFVAQAFNNQGTIVNPYGAPSGGSTPGGGGSPGGTGGGGVVIIAYTSAIGTINVNGAPGGTGYLNTNVSVVGYAAGAGGQLAIVSGISVPIGGTAGNFGSLAGGRGEPNAGGGGAATYDPGAPGGSATVYSFPNGNALITYAVQGISDWWLTNVVGKAPSSVTPLLYVYGSGGGGGGAASENTYGSGGGGGGGGEVIVFGDEVTAGTVYAAGGNGGYDTGNNAGGGGGGGGIVLVFYGPGGLNGTMSLDLAGGGTGVSASGVSGMAGQTGVYLATSVTVNG